MKFFVLLVTLCLALAVAVASCGGSDDSSPSSSESTALESTGSTESTPLGESADAAEARTAPKKKEPEITVPKGASPKKFAIKEIETGTGPGVTRGDTVTINYAVAGYDSKRQVDSSWSRAPYTFTLGSGDALKGGERGIEGMKVGGRRELTIPGNLAYGPKGLSPSIGPNETLIMIVDLLAVSQ